MVRPLDLLALFFKNAIVTLIVGLLVGIFIGLVVVGWWLWPVQWTDAAPVDLSSKFGYQQQYLALVAEHYEKAPNPQELGGYLGEHWSYKDAAAALREMSKDTKRTDKDRLLRLASAMEALQPTEPESKGGLGTTQMCLGGVLVVALLLIAGIILYRMTGGGGTKAEPGALSPVERARASQPTAPTEWIGEQQKPVSQFVTSYEAGDDRYDMSFAIESGPEFLGECGVAISETIGSGPPDKVTALEVWLFDKNDVRTITKVLMSDHCYNDSTLRAKLASKGEAVLIAPDGSVELDTQTLKLRARVIELLYGQDGLPPNSFFNRVKLELAAWPKPA